MNVEWLIGKLGTRKQFKIYNTSIVRIKDLDSTSSHSLQSYVEAIAQVAKVRRLCEAVQACRLGSRTS